MKQIYSTIVLFISFAVVAASAFFVFQKEGEINSSLSADILEIEEQLEQSRVEESLYSGGAILALIKYRIAILENTKAMLIQKRLSIFHKIGTKYTVNGVDNEIATEDRLNEISDEIRELKTDIEDAETRAEIYAGGLIKSMILLEAETSRVSLAQAKLRFIQEKYGIGDQNSADFPKKAPVGEVVDDKENF